MAKISWLIYERGMSLFFTQLGDLGIVVFSELHGHGFSSLMISGINFMVKVVCQAVIPPHVLLWNNTWSVHHTLQSADLWVVAYGVAGHGPCGLWYAQYGLWCGWVWFPMPRVSMCGVSWSSNAGIAHTAASIEVSTAFTWWQRLICIIILVL